MTLELSTEAHRKVTSKIVVNFNATEESNDNQKALLGRNKLKKKSD